MELKLWEEKNSTEPKKNSEINREEERSNSTTKTVNDLIKNDFQDITILKTRLILIEFLSRRKGIIYLITNRINGNRYVGQTIRTLSVRWSQHKKDSLRKDYLLCRAIRKHGAENFDVTVIETTSDVYKLDELEQKYILKYRSFVDWKSGGYNLTVGGNSNGVLSLETKLKIGNRARGRIISEETRIKLRSASNGRIVSEETRRLLSEIRRSQKRNMSEIGRKNISNAHLGNTYTRDLSIHNFFNCRTNDSFSGTRFDFKSKFGLPDHIVHWIIKSNRMSLKSGWRVIHPSDYSTTFLSSCIPSLI